MADPITLTALSLTAVGGAATAAGTIMSGNAAAQAGRIQQTAANAEADQLTENAAGELASSQRKMLDTRLKTNLTESTLTAKAAGSGFNAATGSVLNDAGEIAARGENQALMDIFNGENAQTGLLNKADATRVSGQAQAWAGEQTRDASYLSAAGTIASTAGSMAKTYGSYNYGSYNYRSDGKPYG